MRKRKMFARAVAGSFLDRINKIDRIGDDENPDNPVNPVKKDYQHKAICVDKCGFVDCKSSENSLDVSIQTVKSRSDLLFTVSQITATAQAILDARSLYPDSSLADLYDPLTMPIELRKAHAANDAAVMKAYGYAPTMTEPEIVADLMRRYQELAISR